MVAAPAARTAGSLIIASRCPFETRATAGRQRAPAASLKRGARCSLVTAAESTSGRSETSSSGALLNVARVMGGSGCPAIDSFLLGGRLELVPNPNVATSDHSYSIVDCSSVCVNHLIPDGLSMNSVGLHVP